MADEQRKGIFYRWEKKFSCWLLVAGCRSVQMRKVQSSRFKVNDTKPGSVWI